MRILPKRDPFVLLVGDVITFTVALWVTLALRSFSIPSWDLFLQHLAPFSILFVFWVFVFMLSGLYNRSTWLLRVRLPETILYSQIVNVVLSAIFFFLVPSFGIAPKVVLAIYLLVSSVLIFLWRVYVSPLVVSHARQAAILIGTGSDVKELVEEVNDNPHYPFIFTQVIDTAEMSLAEAMQQLVHIVETRNTASFIVADTSAPIMNAVLPIVYDVAFNSEHFSFIDVNDLYQEVFEKVSLANVRYDWVLSNVGRSLTYDAVKRGLDIVLGLVGCIVLGIMYVFVGIAIKIEDGGEIFISQERVGRFGRTFKILKFRSISGNDNGVYKNGKSQLVVTKVGGLIRKFHIDEFPQFLNLLKGDVSFVGPRPEFPTLAAQYAAKIPFYNARHLIAPGLTGWARLQHKHDPHHGTDIAETKNKLSYDLYYMKHRSVILDVHIIFQTVKFIFGAKGL